MSGESDSGTPPEQFDRQATRFEDLTLSFDAFFGWGSDRVSRLRGRRFRRCNLAGPCLVVIGPGNVFANGIFSACTFAAVPQGCAIPGAILVEDRRFDACILTRWALYLPPAAVVTMVQDMPSAPVFGLPFGIS
jgi:hypothetical protein